MKILFFILTVAFFSPSAVRAETVLDMSSSFQIAKAVKLGLESGAYSASSSTFSEMKKGMKKSSLDGKTDRKCIHGQYKVSQGVCASVANGITCKDGYVKYSRKDGDEVYCVAPY